jgi:predicted GNAT family acetyltransferase
MSETSEQVVVTDAPDEQRFEARIDGELLGIAAYVLGDDEIVFTHTEVMDAAEGRGVGGALVRAALDNVRGRGLRVVPRCPFVRGWIEKHPDYQELVGPG